MTLERFRFSLSLSLDLSLDVPGLDSGGLRDPDPGLVVEAAASEARVR